MIDGSQQYQCSSAGFVLGHVITSDKSMCLYHKPNYHSIGSK